MTTITIANTTPCTIGKSRWIAPYAPTAQDANNMLAAPGPGHLLGTDDLGRDIFSRLIYGAPATVYASVLAVSVAIAIGLPVGLVAGFFGGGACDLPCGPCSVLRISVNCARSSS